MEWAPSPLTGADGLLYCSRHVFDCTRADANCCREGVLNARNLAVELDVEFDDALTTKVEEYLVVAEKEAWRD